MQAQKILMDVNPENYFYVSNGTVLKNLNDLEILLENIDNNTFSCHVNEGKNDFVNWVKDTIKDEPLAKSLEKCKTKEKALACVKKSINSLKKKKHVQTTKEISIKNKKPFTPIYPNIEERKGIISILKRHF